MIAILDACAMIAYLRDEEGAQVIEQFLLEEGTACYAHAINICEVYDDFLRISDQATAKSALQDLQLAGLIIREDMDNTLWQIAAEYKTTYRASLADCFALSLTNRLSGELVTSDHHELEPIQASGDCPIFFFR